MAFVSRRAWMLAWSFVCVLFVGFWSYGLFDLDEGIYAAALSETMQKQELVVVTLDDKPFFEKPILIYWAGMAFVKLGLPGDLGLRLPSVLATIGTLIAVAVFARRRFGDKVALWSVLILASSYLFMLLGRMFTPDAMLVFFMTCGLFAFWESLVGDWRWRFVSAASLGIAVLAKGPMPALIFVFLLAYVLWRVPFGRENLKKGWVLGSLLFAAVVGSWYLPVLYLRGSAFFNEFLIRQNIGRFAGGDVAHLAPFWLYLPIVVISLAPFSFLIPAAWMRARKEPVEKFLWTWVLLIFFLFSLSGTKLPHYILPLYPPLAILLARSALQIQTRARWDFWAYGLGAGVALLIGISYLPPQLNSLSIPMMITGAITFAGTAAAIFMGASGGPILEQGAAVALPLAVGVMLTGPPAYWFATHYDSRRIALDARKYGLPVAEYRTTQEGVPGIVSHPSIKWYLQKRTKEVLDLTELRASQGDQLVISRLHRLSPAVAQAFRSQGGTIKLIEDLGEFQLYLAKGVMR